MTPVGDCGFFYEENKLLLRLINTEFPKRKIVILAHPERRLSDQLAQAVGPKNKRKITRGHLEESLFPDIVMLGKQNIFRPEEYKPPQRASVETLIKKFNKQK